MPRGKRVVLGLVSSKVGALESADALARRIDEAARVVPLEQLALSPQCGFSSTVHGNDITPEVQAAKLRLVVETALRSGAGCSRRASTSRKACPHPNPLPRRTEARGPDATPLRIPSYPLAPVRRG